jgi:hypothetical protein
MFTEPFVLTRQFTTITNDTTYDVSFVASERAADHSTYRAIDADLNEHILFIGHQYGRRSRYTARYTVSGFTPSLLVPDQNATFSQSVYVVADVLPSGPVQSTTAQTNLFRKQMKGIGSLLVAAGAASVEPLFGRCVNLGET